MKHRKSKRVPGRASRRKVRKAGTLRRFDATAPFFPALKTKRGQPASERQRGNGRFRNNGDNPRQPGGNSSSAAKIAIIGVCVTVGCGDEGNDTGQEILRTVRNKNADYGDF